MEEKIIKILAEQTKKIDKLDEHIDVKFAQQAKEIDAKLTASLDKHTKKIDKRLDEQTKELQRQTDASLERHTKDIDARLAEQTKELQRHQKILLEEFDGRLKVVAEVQIDHTEKFKEILKKLDAVMEMTALNTENIEIIKGMLKRKVDFEEYEKLEKRVFLLEKKFRMTGI